ncbi:LysR family transcriptional regulator [Nocardia macrotermitis]|uniref:Hydrogen peroxide-inducible genes activator n=1 Tax=Nocardia macrotermitis TaxID=2585198 RepID=A0A7K0CVL0_9NOCA|nr:LysR family transcriptional regulator [Nocardia macrotermitis]MQY17537.1 Hydrogen peroxide-inducible genes activator [Nocardia macrotermitis]
MDTHRLEYFQRVAEEGSISRAATLLGIAQPALSRQIRLLEEDLGITLFHRTRRGVQLTDDGERLRAATAAPLRQLELALQYAGSPLARIERGVHIGMVPTVAAILSAPLLTSLRIAFPRASFHVTVAGTDQLVAEMLRGTIDTAVINQVSDDRLFVRDLLIEDLVVVGGPNTELRPDHPVTFTRLIELPLLLPESTMGIASSVENTALRTRVRIRSPIVTDSLRVTLDLLARGAGYAVLPLSACGPEIASERLRYAPLIDPALTQHLGVAASARLDLPREFATKIGDVLRQETSELTRSGAWQAKFLAEQRWNPNRA